MKISFFKHRDLSDHAKSKIIDLKNQHWKYSNEQHSDWLKNNLTENDYHLLINDDKDDLVAYLNLVNLKIIKKSGIEKNVLGIGNVCVDNNNITKGLGLLLMQIANYYIRKIGSQGLLICNNSLITFYEKANWTVFEGELFINQIKNPEVIMHLYPMTDNVLIINKSF